MQDVSLKLNRQEFGNPSNSGKVLTSQQAREILNNWVKNERLKVHMKQVAHLMKSYAEFLKLADLEIEKWFQAGLLHDADWDQWPDQHCRKIIEELEAREVDPDIIRAIASHGPRYFGVEPVSLMDKMLYAFD